MQENGRTVHSFSRIWKTRWSPRVVICHYTCLSLRGHPGDLWVLFSRYYHHRALSILSSWCPLWGRQPESLSWCVRVTVKRVLLEEVQLFESAIKLRLQRKSHWSDTCCVRCHRGGIKGLFFNITSVSSFISHCRILKVSQQLQAQLKSNTRAYKLKSPGCCSARVNVKLNMFMES